MTLEAQEDSYTQQKARVEQLREELSVRNEEIAGLQADTKAERSLADQLQLTVELMAAIDTAKQEPA